MPHPLARRCPSPLPFGLAVAVVFGGLWLGHYMMADRPLPTHLASAPHVYVPAPTGVPTQLAGQPDMPT